MFYALTGFSDGPDYFNISSVSGGIFVRKDLRLDLNKKSLYYVSLICKTVIYKYIPKLFYLINIRYFEVFMLQGICIFMYLFQILATSESY